MNIFLIPLYNESENLPELADTLLRRPEAGEDYYFLVDDGSTDNTSEVARECFAGRPFGVLRLDVNRGPGRAFDTGFTNILDRFGDDDIRVITLEGDNTSDLSVLPAMMEASGSGHELVLASVYHDGGGFSRPNKFRRLASNMANGMLRYIFRLDVLTLTSFYRIYNLGALRRIRNRYGNLCSEDGFICKVELLLRARECGVSMKEIPVMLQSHKRKGKSKMKILKTGWQYVRFMIRNRSEYNSTGPAG